MPRGAPDDEYTPEAIALVQAMVKNGEIDFDQVRSTWLDWFDDDLRRLPSAAVDDLVETLNEEFRMARVE